VLLINFDESICQGKNPVLYKVPLPVVGDDDPDTTDTIDTITELTTEDDIVNDEDLITDDNDLVNDLTTEIELTTVETTLKTTPKLTTKQPTTIKPLTTKATQSASIQPTTLMPKNDLNDINQNHFFSCIQSDCQYDYSPVCTVTANNINVTLINFCMIYISNCLANKTIYTFVQNGTCPRIQ